MRRWLVLAIFGVGAAATAAVAVAASLPAGGGDRGAFGGGHGGGYGRGYFAVVCGFSHRNQDDPIVFPNQAGRSHDHTYFGNTATNARSTPNSLRSSGGTTCRLRADTAAYWAPTLFVSGRAVRPLGAVVYYIRRTLEPVRAFPANLEVIAGSAAARSPQSDRVTFWSCGRGGRRGDARRSSAIPTCESPSLRLIVNFPNCWNGSQLDSANHQSHLAYSTNGVCPALHPVEVPALQLQVFYGVSGGANAELASGGDYSGHADFVNAWNQPTLERLVDRYLNRLRRR
jgi:Domain of unknown function (DUF1996)